ncbi:MAG: hypothetical protein MZU97_10610 [Bacillus subtilis]|nr:hypothetical protein [Bacillus subtilis]
MQRRADHRHDRFAAVCHGTRRCVSDQQSIATHRAEHGYTLKSVQGYNQWRYQTLTASGYADMKYRNQWTGQGAALNGPLMALDADAAAVRTFVRRHPETSSYTGPFVPILPQPQTRERGFT